MSHLSRIMLGLTLTVLPGLCGCSRNDDEPEHRQIEGTVEKIDLETGAVRALLAGGADINQTGNEGASPLYMASGYGHEEIVRVLLAAGAETDTVNEYGATALNIASQEGHAEIARALLSAGTGIDHQAMSFAPISTGY